MSLIVKVHTRNGRQIVAVCDKNLLGRVFEEDNNQLDLTASFYQGEEMDLGIVGDLVRNAHGVNLVGEEAVKLGLNEDIIDEEHILKIDGVPCAQAVLAMD